MVRVPRKKHKFNDLDICIRCDRPRAIIVEEELTWCDGTDPIPEFNPRSTNQVQKVILGLGIPLYVKTKSGFSTDSKVLTPLAHYPFVGELLKYRGVYKQLSTYVDPMLERTSDEYPFIHPDFNQTIVMDERLSSSNPNIQNITKRSDYGKKLRPCFVARPGYSLISSDYSQIHLRILAHFSRDPFMVRAYNEGLDLHRMTASVIFDVKSEDVTPEMRSVAKTINFGVIYSIGAKSLAQKLTLEGIPTIEVEAEVYIAKFFEKYRNVKRWKQHIISYARSYGYAPSLYGFKVPLPAINLQGFDRDTRYKRGHEERKAVNSPILCTEAQIVKRAMIKLYTDHKLVPIFQIHDDITYEVKNELCEATALIIKDVMENTTPLRVPTPVDQHVGKEWV